MNRTILDEYVTCAQLKEGRTWRGRRVDNKFKNHETQKFIIVQHPISI